MQLEDREKTGTYTDKESRYQTDNNKHRQQDKIRDRNTQTDKETDRQPQIKQDMTERQTDGRSGGKFDRQAGVRRTRQAYTQTQDIHVHVSSFL